MRLAKAKAATQPGPPLEHRIITLVGELDEPHALTLTLNQTLALTLTLTLILTLISTQVDELDEPRAPPRDYDSEIASLLHQAEVRGGSGSYHGASSTSASTSCAAAGSCSRSS